MNANIHPAADEAESLRSTYDRAYKRTGRTSVGMQIDADQIPEAVLGLQQSKRVSIGQTLVLVMIN